MFFQLLSLRLALALIFLIGGQWATARPQNPYYVENGGQGSQRYHHHGHHGHGYGHGHGPGHGSPNFGGPPSYNPYNVQSGDPFRGGHQPGGHFGGQNFPQPGGDYNRGQSGFRQPGGDFNRGQPGFPQPGGDFNRGQPGFPQPGGDFNRGQHGFRQPGGDFNRGQHGFQQPEGKLPDSDEQLPTYFGGFQQPGSGGNTLQPRPGQNPGGFQQPGRNQGDFQQPGQGQGGFQQPDQNAGGFQQPGRNQGGFQQPGLSQGGFQQPGQSQGGFQQPGQNSGGFQQPGLSQGGFQQPGQNQGGFQQPRPNQGQKPGTPTNTIQPRPGSQDEDFYTGFNFQSPKTLQPRPGQDQEIGGTGSHNTIQPLPGQQQTVYHQDSSPDNVGQNINDLFNTQDFLSPDLSQTSAVHRDPKSEAEEVNPDSVNERNLFDTDPKCSDGTKLMAGRCRKEA
ncbi:glutenin, high molecular weight subunit PW212 [Drosophila elegans]|uniref:glutenin, high molecular weight subunit PW212 n=1 Tax=Drosophila elegans TaxID=30023 RepID=UPI0007E70593|nr:glutenin, high molecular weight subunit PW212 [Drosophila elegans]